MIIWTCHLFQLNVDHTAYKFQSSCPNAIASKGALLLELSILYVKISIAPSLLVVLLVSSLLLCTLLVHHHYHTSWLEMLNVATSQNIATQAPTPDTSRHDRIFLTTLSLFHIIRSMMSWHDTYKMTPKILCFIQ